MTTKIGVVNSEIVSYTGDASRYCTNCGAVRTFES
jgi:hypothetical protein